MLRVGRVGDCMNTLVQSKAGVHCFLRKSCGKWLGGVVQSDLGCLEAVWGVVGGWWWGLANIYEKRVVLYRCV